MDREYFKLKYTDNYFFKYVLSRDSVEAKNVIKTIIEATTSIRPVEVEVTNPILYSENVDDKEMTLDMHILDEKGKHYDIEMQTSSLTNENINRFFRYVAKTWVSEFEKGDYYKSAKATYQIVFINSGLNQRELMCKYEMRDEGGRAYFNKDGIHIIFVCMPNIKYIESFDSFKQLVYLFEYGRKHDKIETSEDVKYMMKSYDNFSKDDREMDRLFKIKLKEAERIEREQRISEEARLQGLQEGKIEGIELGRNEGIKLGRNEGIKLGRTEGIKLGRNEGIEQTQRVVLKELLSENMTDEMIKKVLHLDDEELEKLKKEV